MELNIADILKGREGIVLYSPISGEVELESINYDAGDYPIITKNDTGRFTFMADGRYNPCGNRMLWPSKSSYDKWRRAINAWVELVRKESKSIKTWGDLVAAQKAESCQATVSGCFTNISETLRDTELEKSAVAMMKIYQLIDIAYGGNPTASEKNDWNNTLYSIKFDEGNFEPWISVNDEWIEPIAFYSEKDALEFIDYEDNVKLLRDFYRI